MSISRALLPSVTFALVACGGTVSVDENGSSGDGGQGGGSVSSTATGATGQTATVGTGAGTGPSSVVVGTGVGGSTSVTSTTDVVTVGPGQGPGPGPGPGPGSGGGSSCSDLSYAECIGSLDFCVPQFDDFCCPSCFPGGCADCIDYRSVGCIDRQDGPQPGGDDGDGDDGTPPPGPPPQLCGSPDCGLVPDWACNFGQPDCSQGCFGQAGCVDKIQCIGDECSFTCGAVRPDACGPVNCNAPPPQCGGDQIAEAADGCWTGNCIPLWVCQNGVDL